MIVVYLILGWFAVIVMAMGCWAWVEKLEKAGTASEWESNLLVAINFTTGMFTLLWIMLGVITVASFLIRLMLKIFIL